MSTPEIPHTASDIVASTIDVGTEPIRYLEKGMPVPIAPAGHLIKVTSFPRDSHIIDIYPYADGNTVTFERTDGSHLARLNRTVEAGVLIGSAVSPGDEDIERWAAAALLNGRELHYCRPPLTELTVLVNLSRPVSGVLRCVGIINAHPRTFEDTMHTVASRLGFAIGDQAQIVASAQAQVSDFWMRHPI